MSNENGGPWYGRPFIIAAIATIVVAIIGAIISNPLWVPVIFPPPPDFSISVNPMQGQVPQGGVINTAITVKGEHGYKGSVSLSASGLPSNVVVSFVPQTKVPMPAFTSNMMINVGPNVPVGKYKITIKGIGADGKEHSCMYILTVMPKEVKPTPMPSPTPSPTPTPMPSRTPSPTLTPKKVVNVPDAFFPSGWMGDWGDISLDDACTDNPHSEPTCIKITYSAAKSQGKGWAGIYWQYPDSNWGDNPEGRDLTGATKLTFWARGEKGGEKAEFKVGGITGKYPDSIQPPVSTGVIVLSDKWQQYTIDLTGKDLSHVIGGFCWVTNKHQNPYGCTIYLDDIKFEW